MDSDSSDLSPQITLAAPAPAPAPAPNPSSLTLALPIQHPRIIPGGSNRDDCWSEAATSVLIDAWGERYLELNRGNLRQNHWKEVAEIVGRMEEEGKRVKTDVQCKNRIDTVKKKFKAEKAKAAATGVRSSWVFFDRMERLIGPGGGTTTPATTNNAKKGTMMAAKNNNPLVVGHSSESSGSKVPVGIPMGVRSMSVNKYNQELQQLQSQMKHQQNQMKQQQQQQQQRVMTPVLGRVEQPRFGGNFYDGNANKQPLRFGGFYDNVNREVFVRKRPPVESDLDSDSEEGDGSPDSMDGYPQEMYMRRKKPRVEFNEYEVRQGRVERGGGVEKGHRKGWGDSMRELTEAIVKFGEAYEQAESMKMQQIVEMEKQRMKFAKELELQRMKFLVKTQLELSQLSRNISRVGESNNHRVDNDNDDDKTNSDSSD